MHHGRNEQRCVRLFKKFLLSLVDTACKTLDHTTLAQISLAQLMRKAATVRNTQVTSSGKTPMELALGRKPRDLLDPASMNPESHLEVQQREDICRDLAERMKFVPPDLRAGENVFYWQEDPSKIQQGRKSGKWLKVETIAVKGSMAVVNTGATLFHANISKLRRPLDTLDLEELPDSRERAGVLVMSN